VRLRGCAPAIAFEWTSSALDRGAAEDKQLVTICKSFVCCYVLYLLFFVSLFRLLF
jgi:hypothetical protein